MKIYIASHFDSSVYYNSYFFKKEDAMEYFADDEEELNHLKSLTEAQLDDYLEDNYYGAIIEAEVE